MEQIALLAIARAQAARVLYVSPITAWEAALAIRKRNPDTHPNLLGQDAATWFRDGQGRQVHGWRSSGLESLWKPLASLQSLDAAIPGIATSSLPPERSA
jgi:hypothetical protein